MLADPLASPVRGLALRPSVELDAPELLVLQRCCWVQEAIANDTLAIPPLHEDLDVRRWGQVWTTVVGRLESRLVTAGRGRRVGTDWEVGRLMPTRAPRRCADLAGRGVGRWLLASVEALAPAGTTRTTLFTGSGSHRNLRLYAAAGYVVDEQAQDAPTHVPGTVALAKPR